MLSSFLPLLRESLQCAFLLALLAGYPALYAQRRILYAGTALGFLAGMLMVYVPFLGARAPAIEHWITMRYISEAVLFYSGLLLLVLSSTERTGPERQTPALLLLSLGFALFFFESHSASLYIQDLGLIDGPAPAYAGAALGLLLGFAPLVLIIKKLPRLGLGRFFSPASLLIAVGSVKFITGGLGEVEEGDILIALQQGLQYFVEHLVGHVQSLLMITQHAFISSPLSGLADYLREDRMSTALTVAFVMLPPVLALVSIFSRPDPELRGLEVAAERRLKLAFFRREMVFYSAPVLAAFLLLMFSLHAVNASVNPLSEPEPMPVMESDERPGALVIPLSDRIGDFTDGLLRKYVFYSGNNRIIFLAIMKPDGTVGLALDECEICKPAEWNTSALGYAQRGEHLVCKYCMSPIAIPTVNEPGGCNPVPVPFEIEEGEIVLRMDDLVRVHEALKNLEKKGTHF
jgi:uncharacterized membrane protein